QLAREIVELFIEGSLTPLCAGVAISRKHCKPLIVVLRQVRMHLSTRRVGLDFRVVQIIECRLQNRPPCIPFLRVRSGRCARHSERADQRWKGESLKHKRYKDYAKCEEDNYVPLRERSPIRQHLRQ